MGRFSKYLNDDQIDTDSGSAPAHNVEAAGPEALISLVSSAGAVAAARPKVEDNQEPQDTRRSAQKAWLETKVRIHARLIEDMDLAVLDGLDTPSLRAQVLNIVREIAIDENLKLTSPVTKASRFATHACLTVLA